MKKLIQILVAALIIWACVEALAALQKAQREMTPTSSEVIVPFRKMEAQ